MLGPEKRVTVPPEQKSTGGILGAENSAPKLGCGKSKWLLQWQHSKKNG
jgi:hypothetical protein